MTRSFAVYNIQDFFSAQPVADETSGSCRISGIDNTIQWRATGPIGLYENDPIVGFDAENDSLSKKFRNAIGSAPQFCPGMFDLSGWTQLGSRGFLVHEELSICLIGEAVGWGIDFAKWHTERDFGASWSENLSTVELDLQAFNYVSLKGEHASILAPGQEIYGHWILDHIPRIYSMERGASSNYPLRVVFDRPWMDELYELSRCRMERYNFRSGLCRVRSERLKMPSFLKRGFAIHTDFCREAWSGMREKAQQRDTKNIVSYPKIFVSRSRLSGARQITNIEQIEAAATEAGFELVHPELHSVQEQAAIFRNAEIVIGQDGSGLHNVVFSKSLRFLGVISTPERDNFWHASICAALGAKTAYITAESENDVVRVGIHRFLEMLSFIERNF